LLLMLVRNMTFRRICKESAAEFPVKWKDPNATEPTTKRSLKPELKYC
jgi:hypothetical protein